MKRVPTAILPVAETTTTAVPEPSRAPAQIRVLRCPMPNGRTPPSAASARTAGIHRHRGCRRVAGSDAGCRSEEHTSELQSLMRISYAVFCLEKKKNHQH